MKNKYKINRILRRGLIGILISAMLTTTAFSTATIDILESTVKSIPSSNHLNYVFEFCEPTFDTIETSDSKYLSLNMPGCIGIGDQAGNPLLPAKIIRLMIPPMKSVKNIDVVGIPNDVSLRTNDLLETPLFPHQNPVPFGNIAPQDFVINNEIYSSNSFYPNELFSDYHIGYSHGYTILDVALNPIKYNPVEGKLKYYPELTVKIDLKDIEYSNKFFRNIQSDKEWVESLVYNPDVTDIYSSEIPTFEYPGGLCDPIDDYDYVIITTTQNGLDYWDTSEDIPFNWESLMDRHENDNGYSCTLVTIEDIDTCADYSNSEPIYDDQEAHIREFCKDAYLDWNTSYIFVGGDDEYIRARHMDTNYEKAIDSDIYWSNLDSTFNDDKDTYWGEEGDTGFDLYCELFIGRITCDEPQDVSNWMKKSFYYANISDYKWIDNTAFYGGDTTWYCQGDDFMDFSAVLGTDDWLGPNPHADGPWPTWLGFLWGFKTWNSNNPDVKWSMDNMWTAEPPNPGGWQGGSESAAIAGLREAINNDEVSIISGIAHANSRMSLDVQDSSWESEYHNTKPFFIHDYGCHCGDMDASDDGVLHSMLFHSDTELAFGCTYNTGYGWGNQQCTNSSSALQAKLFWDYFLDVTNNSGNYLNWQLGKGHAWSKDVMAPTIDWDYQYGTWRSIIQGCLLFADPGQRLRPLNAPPEKPNKPSGVTEGVTDIVYEFSSSSTDQEGEQIWYKFNWGDGIETDWLGPYDSGDAVHASHSWDTEDFYNVKVQAKDENNGHSQWSEYLSIHILQAAILNVEIISGGFQKVNAAIKNLGSVDALDVSWTISLAGGVVIKGKETSGNINKISPGEEIVVSSGPVFGFGRTNIKIDAELPESWDDRCQKGRIFLFWIWVRPSGP